MRYVVNSPPRGRGVLVRLFDDVPSLLLRMWAQCGVLVPAWSPLKSKSLSLLRSGPLRGSSFGDLSRGTPDRHRPTSLAPIASEDRLKELLRFSACAHQAGTS